MPVVIVEMWEGRTVDQERQLVEGITASFEEIGVPREAVQVVLQEVPKENWAVAGKLASEM